MHHAELPLGFPTGGVVMASLTRNKEKGNPTETVN
jgi:hypothetical protein